MTYQVPFLVLRGLSALTLGGAIVGLLTADATALRIAYAVFGLLAIFAVAFSVYLERDALYLASHDAYAREVRDESKDEERRYRRLHRSLAIVDAEFALRSLRAAHSENTTGPAIEDVLPYVVRARGREPAAASDENLHSLFGPEVATDIETVAEAIWILAEEGRDDEARDLARRAANLPREK